MFLTDHARRYCACIEHQREGSQACADPATIWMDVYPTVRMRPSGQSGLLPRDARDHYDMLDE